LNAYRIAWVGPDSDDCEFLLNRFTLACADLDLEPCVDRTYTFDFAGCCQSERIVLVSGSRADYPETAVRVLETTTNIVPWAVVTNSWHIGSRRSGVGPVTHFQQPWFRWWDSWFGWFFPAAARLGSQSPAVFAPIVTPLDMALPTVPIASGIARTETPPAVALICSDPLTADMLRCQAKHVGWTAQVYRAIDDFEGAVQSQAAPDVVLWDDSVLPCLPAGYSVLTETDHWHRVWKIAPAAACVVSLSEANLHLWPLLRMDDSVELLIKPSHALGLSNFLSFQSRLV
jgi:hypothetical protein